MGITSLVWEVFSKGKFLWDFITVHESRFHEPLISGESTAARNGEKFCMFEQSRKKLLLSAHTQNICWCDEWLPVRSFTFHLFIFPLTILTFPP